MKRLQVAAMLTVVWSGVACAPLTVGAQAPPELAIAEKAIAATSLFFPDAPLAAAARVVKKGAADGKLKARAARLLEQIATAAIMGEYQSAKEPALFAQVIAWGKGQYQANLHSGSDSSTPATAVLKGTAADGKVKLSGTFTRGQWKDRACTVTVDAGKMVGAVAGREPANFTLAEVHRTSPSLNKPAPKEAVVLFDGKNLDAWKRARGGAPRWKLVPGGAMEVAPKAGGIISKRQFGDHRVHVEFRTPLMPEARGQGRGNSGVYMQGRYEVQVLDSFGLAGRDNECGGIYKVAAPKVNMCYPPTVWQTYDIEFRAARFSDGKITEPPRMTVWHNGVKIHENQALRVTTSAPVAGTTPPGGLFLQDHGNPVQFRNIWIVETKPSQ